MQLDDQKAAKLHGLILQSLRHILLLHFNLADVKMVLAANKAHRAHIYCDVLVGPLSVVKALMYLLRQRLRRVLIDNNTVLLDLVDSSPTMKRMIRLPYTDKRLQFDRFYSHPDDKPELNERQVRRLMTDLMLQPTEAHIIALTRDVAPTYLRAHSPRAKQLTGPSSVTAKVSQRILSLVPHDETQVVFGEVVDDNGWAVLQGRRSRYFVKWISACAYVYKATQRRLTPLKQYRDWDATRAPLMDIVASAHWQNVGPLYVESLIHTPVEVLGFPRPDNVQFNLYKSNFTPDFLAAEMVKFDAEMSGVPSPLLNPDNFRVNYTFTRPEPLQRGEYVSDRVEQAGEDLGANYQIDIIEADCGTGKTVALARRLARVFHQLPLAKILVVAPRISLVRQLKGVLIEEINKALDGRLEVKGHFYGDGPLPEDCQVLTTTVHSLPKFTNTFDVVMIDELETVALNLATDPTLGYPNNRREKVFSALFTAVSTARLVLAIDRDIGLASKMLIGFFINQQQLYTYNNSQDPILSMIADPNILRWQQGCNKVTNVSHVKIDKVTRTIVHEFSLKYALHWLKQMIKNHKRVVVFQTNCEKVYQIEEFLKKECPDAKVLTMTGVTHTNDRTEFAGDPNGSVTTSNCDVLIHTSAVGIGVSITIE